MAETLLGNVLDFLQKVGVYDVLLPFLLVFTVVFAILERTKVLGTEVIDKVAYPKKNLNAMVAFVVGFLVVASSQIVHAITAISAQIVVVGVLVVFFLVLIGSFYKEGELWSKESTEFLKLRKWLIGIVFVAMVFIFLNAIESSPGVTWWDELVYYAQNYITSPAVASIVLIALIIAFMVFITKKPKSERPEGS